MEDVVPSVIKGHVLQLFMLKAESSGCLKGWTGVFGSD